MSKYLRLTTSKYLKVGCIASALVMIVQSAVGQCWTLYKIGPTITGSACVCDPVAGACPFQQVTTLSYYLCQGTNSGTYDCDIISLDPAGTAYPCASSYSSTQLAICLAASLGCLGCLACPAACALGPGACYTCLTACAGGCAGAAWACLPCTLLVCTLQNPGEDLTGLTAQLRNPGCKGG